MEFSEALGASYRLGEPIGSGAAGQVWRAVDTRSGETVAAKILRPEHVADPALVERFVRERGILTGLRHANVVSVRDLVVEGDRIAIVMDYIGGGSLRDVLSTRVNLRPRLATEIVAQVLEGLSAAHRRDIQHRDVKPDNVLLLDDVLILDDWRSNRPDGAKVTDFGIARIISDRPRSSTGLLGTPEYMSPELISTGAAGAPGDVYGAGVLLYELLAGRTPFAGPGTDFTVAYRHVSSRVPELDVPDELAEVLHGMLDKNPRVRPTAADAARSLHRLSAALRELPPLTPLAVPESFGEVERPATAVRGIQESAAPSAKAADADGTPGRDGDGGNGQPPPSLGPIPDLGVPSQATMHRPLPQRRVEPAPAAEATEHQDPKRSWWRSPWVIAAAVGALVLVIGAGVLAIKLGPRGASTAPPPTQKVDFQATQQDQALPTGLGINRKAQYDGTTGQIRLTITYSAQKASLGGPFLEVIPGLTDLAPCPTVDWAEKSQSQNLPSVTGITRRCGWAIAGFAVAKQSKTDVSVEVHQQISGQEQLQDWLDAAAKATAAAVGDDQVSGTAYPVQRLQDIRVSTPSRTVSERTLPVSLIPVWAKGDDPVNPLYKSPSVGDPSAMLVAVAGGESGVQFSDGCSGALSVSSDGLTVTALSQAPECTVKAKVGNFTDLASQPFAIVTRGG